MLAQMNDNIQISSATLDDGSAIAQIYSAYVLESSATFETVPPDDSTMIERMRQVLDNGYPWLVAREEDGTVTGFAYANRFQPRNGFRYAIETSIYVRHGSKRKGVGTALMTGLIAACEARGYRQAFAVIAGTEPASVVLHARAGYRPCGTLENVGRKHGKWIDVFYMQRALGDGGDSPPPDEP